MRFCLVRTCVSYGCQFGVDIWCLPWSFSALLTEAVSLTEFRSQRFSNSSYPACPGDSCLCLPPQFWESWWIPCLPVFTTFMWVWRIRTPVLILVHKHFILHRVNVPALAFSFSKFPWLHGWKCPCNFCVVCTLHFTHEKQNIYCPLLFSLFSALLIFASCIDIRNMT